MLLTSNLATNYSGDTRMKNQQRETATPEKR